MAHKFILVVEDDFDTRQSMKTALELEGYKVLLADDAESAAGVLKHAPELPGLILLDLLMPRGSGWEFLDFQKSHERFRGIPLVICSAYEESAKALAPIPYLPKPLGLEKLLSAVKTHSA